jgi:2-haloacid dehalogenase
MKKTIIFDLGGVLVDWNPQHLFRKIFPDQEEMDFFLRAVCSPEWNAQLDRGYPFKVAIAELTAEHPEYTDQINAYFDRWDEMISGSFPETVKILKKIKDDGYPLVALSNWSVETFPIALERFEFLSWFDPLIISGEIDLVKPAPEIYHYLLREISREAEECIFIDDSEANVLMAEELGFISIHFSSPEQLQVKLEEIGVVDYG